MPFARSRAAILPLAVVVAALLGLGFPQCSSPVADPAAEVETPSGLQSGAVTIRYTLSDFQSRRVSIAAEFSLDQGASWRQAATGPGGDGTTNLATGIGGVAHTYVWIAANDLGATYASAVLFRITPSHAGKPGRAGTSSNFAVDGVAGANRPPELWIVSPEGEPGASAPLVAGQYFYGPIGVTVRLKDHERDPANLVAEHSTDGGATWRPMTLDSSSGPIQGLATDRDRPVEHTFSWNTFADVGRARAIGLAIRVTPADAKPGRPALVQYLHVDNTALAVVHPPYLQSSSHDSAWIHWRTDKKTQAVVRWGTTATDLRNIVVAAKSDSWHEVSVTGLPAGSTHFYRATSGDVEVTARPARLRTHPRGDTPFRFTMFGDSGSGDANQLAIANLLGRLDPDFHLMLGDIVYSAGALGDYPARYFEPYRKIIDGTVFFPTPGNHDYATAKAGPYRQVFRTPANNPDTNEFYYSFDYANARFIGLDSNQSLWPYSKQHNWLVSELAQNRQTWTFVFFHHPPYSATEGRTGDFTIRSQVCPVFEEYEVDLVLCGHDHNYQRTQVMKDHFPAKRGVIYVTNGGGGKGLYDIKRHYLFAVRAKTFAITQIEVSGRSLKLTTYDASGQTIDSLALSK